MERKIDKVQARQMSPNQNVVKGKGNKRNNRMTDITLHVQYIVIIIFHSSRSSHLNLSHIIPHLSV